MTRHHQSEILIIGAGLAGITCALELLEKGHQVLLLDAAPRKQCGGQANDAFGGMLFCDTPEQRRLGLHDSSRLLLADWRRAAAFQPEDHWGHAWATAYAEHARGEVYDWLKRHGIRFLPMVQWVERGNHGDGNSLPRYHVAWGCGRGIVQTLASKLFRHRYRHSFTALFDHQVDELMAEAGQVVGARGRGPDGEFEAKAAAVVVAGGGINGNPERVRAHWDPVYGNCPDNLLLGTDPRADGRLHDAVANAGGRVGGLGRMWNYAAGIAHPAPRYPHHGESLIPARSALWLDAHGRRIGPAPLVSGRDTHDLCKTLGHLPGQYGWQILNWKIAIRELAVSGTDSNPHFRDRRLPALLWQQLSGNRALVSELIAHYPDVLAASSLQELAVRMQSLAADGRLTPGNLYTAVYHYDTAIERGPALHNDEQIAVLQQMRRWRGDRMRLCNMQRINEPTAGPLIAIRTRLLCRKSLGGMHTDLDSRVVGKDDAPLPGLYAIGEAAGFGGGGICGIRSLEGTFLSGCIFTARRAARHLAGLSNP